MHDCALGREGKPSAPRVEHKNYAGDGLKWASNKNRTKFESKKSNVISIDFK